MKHIIIETTDRCNLKCPGCYREYAGELGTDMDFGLFLQILDQFQAGYEINNMPTIVPFSHGEPTLYPQFLESCQAINNRALPFVLSTNGTGKLDEVMAVSNMLWCNQICFSLDGFATTVRANFRPGSDGAGAQAEAVIEKNGSRVLVSLLDMGQPQDDIDLFIKYWLGIGARAVIIRKPLRQEPLAKPVPGWKACRYHDEYYLTIKATGLVKLCERNVNSPVIGDLNVSTLEEILAEHTKTVDPDYCAHCAQRYTGDTLYGMVQDANDRYRYYIRKDYFNTIYSLTSLRWGVAWEDAHAIR